MDHILTNINSAISQHAEVLARTRECAPELARLVVSCVDSLRNGGKLLFFGNGGSAADSQHIATELTIRYSKDRPAIPAIALTTDTSALTAAGNDLGFDQLFSRQIEALGRPGDVAIGISTSGNSPNIVKALEVAKAKGLTAAGFSGRDGGKMTGLVDLLVIVPSNITSRIQEMHSLFGHVLCEAIELELGLVD